MIHVGGMDPLRDEGFAYAELLQSFNVPIEVVVCKRMPHCLYGALSHRFSKEYFDKAVEFVNLHSANNELQGEEPGSEA